MKRYSFRLAHVQRVRQLQEDMARSGVLNARRVEDAAARTVEQRQSRYAELAGPAPAQSPREFLAWRDQAGHRAGAVVTAHGQLQAASATTAAALDGWRVAHRRVEALERLDERRRDEHTIDVRRDEDAHADEVVVARARRPGRRT